MELILGLIFLWILIEIVIPVVVWICGAVLTLMMGAGSIALVVAFVAAIIVGTFVALKNYVIAICNNINFLSWEWEKSSEPARRSYFFGPGYVQLRDTVKEAFIMLTVSAGKMSASAKKFADLADGLLGFALGIIALVYKIVGYICIYGIGTALGAALAAIHGSVTFAVMVVIYIVFSIVWLVDRLYLLKNKIRSICPVCKSRFLIPVFECPDCGAMHRSLVPGPYGIWHHRCDCGRKLPATFLNGRSSLNAYCPDCGSSLVASDARPVVFQLIGGTKSGKTVYLSAFFHEFVAKIRKNSALKVEIADEYKPYFEDLESWYEGGSCPATTQLNSQMYPLIISGLGTKRQFSVFDIAGEMFDGVASEGELAQQQFTYCDGLLFMIDPFSNGRLRADRERSNQDVSDFSDMAVEDVASNFINYMVRVGNAKVNTRCSIPLSILITKADIREVRREIGPAKVASIMRNNPDKYATVDEARDAMCRQFLIDIGMVSAVEDLETQFSNIHYYPVSAQGHSTDGTAFEPWGIMEAVDWMLPVADSELAAALNPEQTKTT